MRLPTHHDGVENRDRVYYRAKNHVVWFSIDRALHQHERVLLKHT